MGFIITVSLLVTLGVIVAVALYLTVREDNDSRTKGLKRRERKELDAAREALDQIKALAYEYRTLDSNLSYRVIDTLEKYENSRKELR
jgi:hypothetical protein